MLQAAAQYIVVEVPVPYWVWWGGPSHSGAGGCEVAHLRESVQLTLDLQGEEKASSDEDACEKQVLDKLLATLQEDVECSRCDKATSQEEVLVSHGQPEESVAALPPTDVNQDEMDGVIANELQMEPHPWRGRRRCWKVALCWVVHHLIQALVALLSQLVPGVHLVGSFIPDVVAFVELATGVVVHVALSSSRPMTSRTSRANLGAMASGVVVLTGSFCARAIGRMRRRAM